MVCSHDNHGVIPHTVTTRNFGTPNWAAAPSVIRTTIDTSNPNMEWSIELMSNYLSGATPANLWTQSGSKTGDNRPFLGTSGFKGVWNCPGAAWNRNGVGYGTFAASDSRANYYYRFAYCYYGWAQVPQASAGWHWGGTKRAFSWDGAPNTGLPAGLTNKRLDASSVLMTDQLSLSTTTAWDSQLWYLNHFKGDARKEYEQASGGGDGTTATATPEMIAQRKADNPDKIGRRWDGGNQLWGDGRVTWIPASRFKLALMAKMDGGSYGGMPYTPGAPSIAADFRWYWYPNEAHVWVGAD
jgi:hypothetical protein